uniref:Uncharacterized protein n=1 Tax=Ciona intestinalis TaxID=7719 RepID=H2Y365_CIOIN
FGIINNKTVDYLKNVCLKNNLFAIPADLIRYKKKFIPLFQFHCAVFLVFCIKSEKQLIYYIQ